jgi:hypothetical protein
MIVFYYVAVILVFGRSNICQIVQSECTSKNQGFSTTIVANSVNSSDTQSIIDEAIPVPCNFNILKEIFEWLKHNIYFLKRKEICINSKVITYDRNWINYIDKTLNINSFQLINISNFLGIELLIEILSVYIAENHESRNFKLIVKAFFNRKKDNIPLEIPEKL